jgi:putative ABC transport system ATP-binding protein
MHANGLCFAYPSSGIFHFPDLWCDVHNPLLITGKPGCGKTTLLYLLAGILRTTNGRVFIDHTNITALPAKTLDAFRGQNIGILFPKTYFLAGLTVMDNIKLAGFCSHRKTDNRQIILLAQKLGIEGLLSKHPLQLDMFDQQCIVLARALSNGPKLILADDPARYMNDDSATRFMRILLQQAEAANAALVVATRNEKLKEYFHHHIAML